MNYSATLEFARSMDKADSLAPFREKFHIPKVNGTECAYFCGNSLGLQPKSAKELIARELKDWAELGVHGHFKAKRPWFSYHEMFAGPLARLTGALPLEVVAMNALTVNLHLLMISFYKPSGKRFKILCEKKAFPSDQYAMESQVRLRGFNPMDAIIEVGAREGEHCLRNEDILTAIEANKEELALVMFGGVNFYTGQKFDMQAIAYSAKSAGAMVGFDLAHAAGNVCLRLHDWEVDFACWCSYKYLNSGSGSVAGAFVHEKHFSSDFDRLAGWWGYDKTTRFNMEKGFNPIPTAEGWQLSNAPVLSMAAHKAALDIFDEADMEALFEKRDNLTGYMEFLINECGGNFQIITPSKKEERGSQLSLVCGENGKEIYDEIGRYGIVADWRPPNVIRLAPVPLYNTFEDVYRFGEVIKNIVTQRHHKTKVEGI